MVVKYKCVFFNVPKKRTCYNLIVYLMKAKVHVLFVFFNVPKNVRVTT